MGLSFVNFACDLLPAFIFTNLAHMFIHLVSFPLVYDADIKWQDFLVEGYILNSGCIAMMIAL